MRRVWWFLTCILLAFLASNAFATVYYVDLGRPDDSGDGLSWATAKKTISAAIAVAPGILDEVWVKMGTYRETVRLKTGVGVFGGFNGTESAVGLRNATANLTIIDASTVMTPRFHVVTIDTLGTTGIDGFTITGGNANGVLTDGLGGGVYVSGLLNTNVAVSNCIIVNNAAALGGGGIYCNASSPIIRGCVVIGNASSASGGGILLESASPSVDHTKICWNSAQDFGGGLSCNLSSAALTACFISGNSLGTANYGGGIYCNQSPLSIVNCAISGNVATFGAGMACEQSSPTVVNCTISSGTASTSGGGIFCRLSSSPALTNTLFENNTNRAVYEGDSTSDPIVRNCLFFNNPNGDYYNEGTTGITVAVLNGLPGNGNNLTTDPKLFMNGPNVITGTWTAAPTYDAARNLTTLTNGSAGFVANALVGRILNSDTSQRKHSYIVANTATTIQVIGDARSIGASGHTYKVTDYHLLNFSAAVDTGTGGPSVPSVDIEGSPRPVDNPNVLPNGTGTEFDIGAYEAPDFPPIVTSSVRANPSPTNLAIVSFTVTFDEPVTGVDTGDFALTASGVSGPLVVGVVAVGVTGTTYTVSVDTGAGSGTIRLDVSDNDTILDSGLNPLGGPGLGNGNFTTGETYTIDKTLPFFTAIAAVPVSAKLNTVVTIKFTASEILSGNPTVTVNTHSATYVSASGLDYTYTYTVQASDPEGAATILITGTDMVGNSGSSSSDTALTIHKTPPSVLSVTKASPDPTNASSVDFTVTFSEAVTGVDAPDFSLLVAGVFTTAPSIASVTGLGAIWTVTVNTGTGTGTIELDVVDDDTIIDTATNPLGGPGAGNGNFNSGVFYTFDNVPPKFNLLAAGPSLAKLNTSVTLTFQASEILSGNPTVTVNTHPATFVSVAPGPQPIYNYNYVVQSSDPDGFALIAITGSDPVGNSGSSSSNTALRIDETPPKVLMSARASANPTNATLVNFTLTFSESVTGVDLTDLQVAQSGVTGASATAIVPATGPSATYTVTVNTGSGSGFIRLDVIDNDSIIDAATNPLGGPGLINGNHVGDELYTIDKTPPLFDPIAAVPAFAKLNVVVSITFTASEPLAAIPTVTVNGNPAAYVSNSGNDYTYTYTIQPTDADGAATIIITGSDILGNSGPTTNTTALTVDKTPPTVLSITPLTTSPTSGNVVEFVVHFNESVLNFDAEADLLIAQTQTVAHTGVAFAGGPSTYTVSVTGVTGDGTLAMAVSTTSGVQDLATNPLASSVSSAAVVIDHTPPIVDVITPVNASPTNSDTVTFLVSFTEDVVNFDATDLIIAQTDTVAHTGVTISGGPADYTVDVTGVTGDGTISLSVNTASDIQDTAGNPLFLSVTSAAVTVDHTGPACIAITHVPTGKMNNGVVSFLTTFSEAVTNFNDAGDLVITLTGTAFYTGVTISGGPLTYLVDLDGVDVPALNNSGTLTVAVDTSSDVEDLAGNALTSTVTSDPLMITPEVPVVGLVGLGALLGAFALAGALATRRK